MLNELLYQQLINNLPDGDIIWGEEEMISVPSALRVLGHKKLSEQVAKELLIEEPIDPEKVIAAALAAKGNKDEEESKEVEANEAA